MPPRDVLAAARAGPVLAPAPSQRPAPARSADARQLRPTRPGWAGLRTVVRSLAVIAAFTAPAVVLWWHAWAGGPASTIRCACLDPGQQVWFVAWPAFALVHGLNPFTTTWLWPPLGANLLANASSPLVGLVLAPVTWLFGPFVSTNVALTLAPGLSAWGGWWACRRFTRWPAAAWIGGFVYGYSPFVVDGVAQGHLSISLLVLPPVMLVVLHEMLVRQQRSARWCGVVLGIAVTAQFLISPEVLAITGVLASVGVVAAVAANPRQVAARAGRVGRAFAWAAGTAAVLLAAPVWSMQEGPQSIKGPIWRGAQAIFGARPYQLWNPGSFQTLLEGFPHTPQGPALAFVGSGVLVGCVVSLAVGWRRRAVWVFAVTAAAATVCSWGAMFWPDATSGSFSSWLPWGHVTNLPLLDNVLPVRFPSVGDLAFALVLAVGLDAASRWRLWRRVPAVVGPAVAVCAAAACVVPAWATYDAPLAVQRVVLPPWYASVGRVVHPGSVVVSYPFPASSSLESSPMVWQAADDMRFRLAGGYVKVPGPGGGVLVSGRPTSATSLLEALTDTSAATSPPPPPSPAQLGQLRDALRFWGAAYLVVADTGPVPVEAAAVLTAATGVLPDVSHRAWVWDVSRTPLRVSYDLSAASRAVASCGGFSSPGGPARRFGPVAAHRPLPQSLNRCVVASL